MNEQNKLIVEHREVGKYQDSLSIGSSARNCEMKVYCDFNNPEQSKKKVDEAIKLRTYLMEKIIKKWNVNNAKIY